MKAFSFDWAAGLNASDIWKRKFSFQVPGATLAWWMELSLTPQSELFQLRGNVPQTRLMYFQQILGNSYLLRTQSLCTCCSDFVVCLRFIPICPSGHSPACTGGHCSQLLWEFQCLLRGLVGLTRLSSVHLPLSLSPLTAVSWIPWKELGLFLKRFIFNLWCLKRVLAPPGKINGI